MTLESLTYFQAPPHRPTHFDIGTGGHEFVLGHKNIPKSVSVEHHRDTPKLHQRFPFALRAVEGNSKLPAIDESRYLEKAVVEYAGSSYYAYYRREIPVEGRVPRRRFFTLTKDDISELLRVGEIIYGVMIFGVAYNIAISEILFYSPKGEPCIGVTFSPLAVEYTREGLTMDFPIEDEV